MVRNRIPKTDRGKRDGSLMRRAVEAVGQGRSIREVAHTTGVNRTTLSRYIKRINDGKLSRDDSLAPRFNTRQVFTKDEEGMLAEYIIACSAMFHGLGYTDVRKLAYEFADQNGKAMPESWQENIMAGEDWMFGFMKRHQQLSLRTPEATSIGRAQGFNEVAVQQFYSLLTQVMSQKSYPPDSIYNLDETGITTVQSVPKIITIKGVKQVGQISAAERGVLVTACCCINAAGRSLPPALIFPRVNYKDHMSHGAPAGTLGLASASGWMNSELFPRVLQHFICHIGCSKENPAILVMDNHDSHLSLEVVDMARENGLTIVTFPPHCSHRLQPLDVSVYGPLKKHYNKAINEWNLSHPGKRITIYDLPGCFNRAFHQALSYANIVAGFRKTGIFPLNSDIFTSQDYLPATVFKPAQSVAAATGEPQLAATLTALEVQPAVTPTAREPQPAMASTAREPYLAVTPTARGPASSDPNCNGGPANSDPHCKVGPVSNDPNCNRGPVSRPPNATEVQPAVTPTATEVQSAVTPTAREPQPAMASTAREPYLAVTPTARGPASNTTTATEVQPAVTPTATEVQPAVTPTARQPQLTMTLSTSTSGAREVQPAVTPSASASTSVHLNPMQFRSPLITPDEIRPLPKLDIKIGLPTNGTRRPRRKLGYAKLLTSTPEKINLVELASKRNKRKGPPAAKRKPHRKIKSPVKKTVTAPVSDRDDSSLDLDFEPLDTSEDSELSDLMRHIQEEEEEISNLLDQDNYRKGDYVMVKFAGKQIISYYVGQIEDIDTEVDEMQTNFLRRSDLHKGILQFTWPHKKDISWHERVDIVLKLPKPRHVGGTNRTANKLSFPCNLAVYDNQLL